MAEPEERTTEDKAAEAWLDRLGAYLVAQMEQGFIAEAEADLIWADMIDRLDGQGRWEGMVHTLQDLPSEVLNDVERYWTSLPAEAQKAAELKARETQQDIQTAEQLTQAGIEQRGRLPLNAGGTPEEQANAGMTAINTLKRQMANAPANLKDIMGVQISQLEESLNQIRGNIRLDARQGTFEGERLPEDEIRSRLRLREQEAEEKEPLEISKRFAEKYGMTPESAQRTGYNYIDNPDDPEYANLSREEKIDLEWVGLRAHEDSGTRKEPAKPVETPGFEGIATQGSQQWRSWFKQNYPSIVSQFETKPDEAQTSSGWDAFLEKERTRLKEQYLKRSPYQRGERPGSYAPKIKTVAF